MWSVCGFCRRLVCHLVSLDAYVARDPVNNWWSWQTLGGLQNGVVQEDVVVGGATGDNMDGGK